MIAGLQNPWVRQSVAALGIGVVVALIGPFGTFHELALPARVLYWVPMVAIGWAQWILLGRALDAIAERRFGDWLDPWWGREVVLCFLTPIPLTLEIVGMRAAFGLSTGISWLELYVWTAGTTLLIGALVAGIIFWARAAVEADVDAGDGGGGGNGRGCVEPRFLRRLPLEKQGRLLCLKTEDHYLRVYTDRGEALILLRLIDALRELEGHDGRRVHRSYWVSRDAVEATKRHRRKTRLRLTNGLEVPVSETYLPKLREDGWLA